MSESFDLTLESFEFLGASILIIKGKKPSVIYPGPVNAASRPYILIESFGRAYRLYTDDSSCRLAYEDDVLIVWDGERAGLTSYGHSGYIGSTLAAIRITDESLDSNYLFYVLEKERDSLRGSSEGTGVPHLSRWAVENIRYFKPKRREQKKIATILLSIDDLIEKMRLQIDKLKSLKIGTMQELMTQGVGHTAFKDSPVGRIPASWEITDLGSIVTKGGLQTGPFGSQLHAHEYIEWGTPVVMPKDMTQNQVNMSSIARISPQKVEELKKHRVIFGDILFSRRGDIGRFVLIDKESEGAICGTGCLRVRLSKKIDPVYFACYLSLSRVIEWLNGNAVGQTMLNLNTSILADLPVVLPSQAEQLIIKNSISAIEKKIQLTSRKLLSLQTHKKALMQDLLTGKVRVKVDSPKTVAA